MIEVIGAFDYQIKSDSVDVKLFYIWFINPIGTWKINHFQDLPYCPSIQPKKMEKVIQPLLTFVKFKPLDQVIQSSVDVSSQNASDSCNLDLTNWLINDSLAVHLGPVKQFLHICRGSYGLFDIRFINFTKKIDNIFKTIYFITLFTSPKKEKELAYMYKLHSECFQLQKAK